MERLGKNHSFFGLFLAILFLTACSDSGSTGTTTTTPTQQQQKTPEKPKKEVVKHPTFNEDSTYAFIEKQVAFGPRTPNSEAQLKCAEYLQKKFESYGGKVYLQKAKVKGHDGKSLRCINIIARFHEEKTSRIMYSAHWDTRPWADQDVTRKDEPIDGANDGGSGVAVILEMARLIQQQAPTVGVDFVLFDVEDYGKSEVDNSFCLGSQYWGKNPPIKDFKPRYAVNLDMVGGKDPNFAWDADSYNNGRDVLMKYWNKGVDLGYSKEFLWVKTGPMIDDHVYVTRLTGIPAIDILDFQPRVMGMGQSRGFNATWHTHNDNLSNISRHTLKAVGRTVTAVMYEEK